MNGPMRVLLVDDESPARRRLRDLLGDLADAVPTVVAGEAENGRQAIDFCNRDSVDVVLMDVRMPVMDGIEAAGHLAALPVAPVVVFVTAYGDHALDAFEVNALDYLIKPVRVERLAHALSRAKRHSDTRQSALDGIEKQPRGHLSVVERGRILLVPVADVLFLHADLKYVRIRTREREFLIEDSLTRLEAAFGDRFVRIHRNCLVRAASIAGLERGGVQGADVDGHSGWIVRVRETGERLPVSRRQQTAVKKLLKG